MQVNIYADELALITAHYNRLRDQAYDDLARAEKAKATQSAEEAAALAQMQFMTADEAIAEARGTIADCTARLDHYSPIIAAAFACGHVHTP